MARPCAFLMALVLMSYWSTCSLGCDLPQTHNLRNKGALTLLAQMRRLSPLSCLKDRKDFAFPLEKVDAQQIQKTQVIPVLQELTQQVLILFSSKDSSAAWETTLLDTFCTGLHHQLKDLQACLMQQVGVQKPPHEPGRLPGGCEEILPQDHCLPEREETQPLCLGGGESRSLESPVFLSQVAVKIE